MSAREIKDAAVAAARAELPESDWFDTNAAAAYLSVRRQRLEQWRSAGGGPPYTKYGRFLRYLRQDIDAWMASHRVENTAQEVER